MKINTRTLYRHMICDDYVDDYVGKCVLREIIVGNYVDKGTRISERVGVILLLSERT